MWFCIIEGAFSYKLENDSRYCALEVGDIVLIPRGMEHSLKLRSETGKMISVHFMAQVYQSVGLLSILRLHGKVTGGKEILIGRNREMAREFALKEPGWEWLIDGGIKETLILAMRSRQNREAKSIDPTIIRGLVRLQPTLELVRERLHERDLKVEEMARRIFVSEVYLRKLFTRTLGVSPVEYIQRQRISHACSLLKNSDESIQEIASACGFSDQSFFYRVFKKHAGTTPQQYREHTE